MEYILIFTQLKFHLNSVKIYQSGKIMQLQYIDHSYLGSKFSFLSILIITLIDFILTFHQICLLLIYILPSLHFHPKAFAMKSQTQSDVIDLLMDWHKGTNGIEHFKDQN